MGAIPILFLLSTLLRSLWRSLRALLLGPARLPTRQLSLPAPLHPAALLAALQAALPPAAPSPLDAWLAPFLGTFHAVLQLFSHPHFPFPLLGALHVSSAITVGAGCAEEGASAPAARVSWDAALDTRAVAKGVEVTVAVAAGPWRARHTFLFLGARLAPQDCELLRQAAPEACPAAQAAGEGAAEAEAVWGSPAAQLAPLPLPLSASLGRTWAALSHDFNPIHMSAWAAYCFGLRGGMVAHGMAVVLLALRRAQQEQQLSGAAAAPLAGELRARFLRPLFLPDAHCTLALMRASAKPASPPQAGMLHTSLSIVSRGKECFVAELRY